MKNIAIRDAREEDYPFVVKLNDTSEEYTSPMDLDRLRFLASLATYFRVAVSDGRVIAFLLAMKVGVPYQNDNYAWFAARYDSFLYIDRIVVAEEFQGCGIGTKLYEDIIAYARQEPFPYITCEINMIPPNEKSAAFHSRLGFNEVGSQWIGEGQKKVSMKALYISHLVWPKHNHLQ